MNTVSPDNLENRLRQDAKRIKVGADEHFMQRISNQLTPPVIHKSRSSRRSYWAWGLAAPAALAVILLIGRVDLQAPRESSLRLAQPLVSHLEMDLDKALASRETHLGSELLKVENDLQKLSSVVSLNGVIFAK